MFEDFDFFSQIDSVDYSTFEPSFTWGDFDAGLDIPADAGFDFGGIGDASSYGGDYIGDDSANLYSAPAQDGGYTDLGGDWSYGTDSELNIPSGQNGIVWEPDYPYSADGTNLPNVSGGQLIDVAKAGASVYTQTQSGSKPTSTRATTTPQGASTNSSVFGSILGNLTGAVKAGATAVANIEDTRQRIVNANTVNTARGAGSGILGPRTGTTKGTAVKRTGADTGFTTPTPVLIGLAAIAGFLVFKGAA